MASQTIVMPELGESVLEGVVVQWLVEVGQHVSIDTPLAEIETDKATVEFPSPMEGYVAGFLVEIDDVVEVGEPLMELSTEKPDGVSAPALKAAAAPATNGQAAAATPAPQAAAPTPAPAPAAPAFAAPAAPVAAPAAGNTNAFRVSQANGFDASAAAPVAPPSVGPGNWANLKDLMATVGASAQAAAPAAAAPAKAAKKSGKAPRWTPFGHPEGAKAYRYPQPTVEEGDTVEKFSRRRKIIAEHMVISQSVSPHVVTVAEIDMTNIVKLRNAHKKRLKAQGISVTYLSFVLKATVEALMEYPQMNAVVGDGEVILKKNIHLGCAVETPAGLVVPVIRDANSLNLVGLSMSLGRLAKKARDGKLEPDDVNGGTFTVTNPGLKGNLYGGAIINQPQIGIVRMGEIKKRPMVITRDGEDVIAIRHMMYIALSYDHRVVDGVTGNGFLFRIRELLEAANFQL